MLAGILLPLSSTLSAQGSEKLSHTSWSNSSCSANGLQYFTSAFSCWSSSFIIPQVCWCPFPALWPFPWSRFSINRLVIDTIPLPMVFTPPKQDIPPVNMVATRFPPGTLRLPDNPPVALLPERLQLLGHFRQLLCTVASVRSRSL